MPTPLDGKRPVVRDWQSQPTPSQEDVRAWAERYNYGIRTGRPSGVIVLDVDSEDAWETICKMDEPPTPCPTVRTGRGRHLYFAAPSYCPGNKVNLWPGIDLRGEGGQVVGAGSIHPTTGAVYEWEVSPEEVSPPHPPAWLLQAIKPPEVKPVTDQLQALRTPGTEKYAESALQREIDALSSMQKGGRNHALNSAAFSLGQLVSAGLLEKSRVAHALMAAASQCGLVADDGERTCWNTIQSGLSGAEQKPRASLPEPPKPFTLIIGGKSHTWGPVTPSEAPNDPFADKESALVVTDLADPQLKPVRPRFLVRNLIRAEGMHLVWAQPGGYKTRMTLRILLELLNAKEGDRLLGHPDLPIWHALGRVLLLTTEEDAGELRYVTETVLRGMPGQQLDRDRLVHVYAHQPGRAMLTTADLPDLLDSYGPFDMVVLDSLTGLRPKMPGVKWDVDNDAANIMCLQLRRLIAERHIALWVIHHSDKLVSNYRGPTEWWASTDIMLGLLADKDNDGDHLIKVLPQKTRGGAVMREFHVRPTWSAEPTKLELEHCVKPDLGSKRERELYEALQETGPVELHELVHKLGWSKTTVKKYILTCVNAGRIEIQYEGDVARYIAVVPAGGELK